MSSNDNPGYILPRDILSATARDALESASIQAAFAGAAPFPLVVIDDFLRPDVADKLLGEIKAVDDIEKSSDYFNAKNKFEYPHLEQIGSTGSTLREFLTSDYLAGKLSYITGHDVFVDDTFLGGGVHVGKADSYLDMHADFNTHPVHSNWLRELNILLYLNRDWQEGWGGQLDLKNRTTGATDRVEPRFNRLVIMATNDITLHGYSRIAFPEGHFRLSVASYAYSISSQPIKKRSTLWRSDNAFRRALSIPFSAAVQLKNMLFGSSTARRAKRD